MPYFEKPEEIYEHLGALFQQTSADEEGFAQMRAVDAIVQYRLRKPDAQMTVSMLADAPPQVDLGPTHLRPDVVVRTDSDTLHRYFLGRVNPSLALSKRQLSVDGDPDKVLRLITLSHALVARYTQAIEASGREDLVADPV